MGNGRLYSLQVQGTDVQNQDAGKAAFPLTPQEGPFLLLLSLCWWLRILGRPCLAAVSLHPLFLSSGGCLLGYP